MPQSSSSSLAKKASGIRYTLAYSMLRSFSLGVLLVIASPLESFANSSSSSLIQRERIKRQLEKQEAMKSFLDGIEYQKVGDFENAVIELQAAYELMPRGADTVEHIDSLEQWYVLALVSRSRQMTRDEGLRVEGQQLAERALSIRPQDPAVVTLVDEFNDPNNISLGEISVTPEFKADVAEVRSLLKMAESQYRTGQYKKAKESYNKILLIDPTNSASQRGLEMIAREYEEYGQDAYNRTRAELLAEVTNSWALPVPIEIERRVANSEGGIIISPDDQVRARLERITLDVDFAGTPLPEVIDFLRAEVRSQIPAGEPTINFVINIDDEPASTSAGGGFDDPGGFESSPTPSANEERLVRLVLTNVTMIDLLEFISDQTDTAYTFDRGVVVIRGSGVSTVITETFEVPPNFVDVLSGSSVSSGGASTDFDPFAATPAPSSGGPKTVQSALTDAGVIFDAEGSFARMNNVLQRLQVAVTADQMPLVEQIVADIRNQGPKQVRISTRFIEVQENKEDEFGFDWLLGQFSVGGGQRLFGSGGTPATGTGLPFVFPNSGEEGVPVGGNRLGGIRSGGTALNSGAIDNLLATGSAVAADLVPSPGLFSLAGVFSDPQFQVVLRALNQSTGADLMTAPQILTQPNQEGKIEIIREFIYPGDYDPPEIPQAIGGNDDNDFGQAQANSFPVTPATPRDWQTEQLGVTLTVTPRVSRDNTTISLSLQPEITEFDGFINYGTPIQTAAINALGQPVNVVLTENRILQPVFSKRTVITSATVFDGSTIAIGGLIREDVQQFEDKLPILGDIPIIGRLFQSRGESHLKRNLVIFVTAELIGPDGRTLRSVGVPEESAPVRITPGTGAIDSGALSLFELENK